MGVIHKLREDVVVFIVVHKKNAPSISVRQLAAITSEKFQIKVSKSSVNSVLKKAALSSSVGRRAGSAAHVEKFAIPEVKKKQISDQIKASGFIPDIIAAEKTKAATQKPEEKKEAPIPPREEKKEKPAMPAAPEVPSGPENLTLGGCNKNELFLRQ